VNSLGSIKLKRARKAKNDVATLNCSDVRQIIIGIIRLAEVDILINIKKILSDFSSSYSEITSIA
jgi:hypothetical protein